LRFLLSPINPADINVVQGVYPSKPVLRSDVGLPNPVFIGGNEGVAEVTVLGDSVSDLKVGDWVTIRRQQVGTWTSHANLHEEDVMLVPRREGSKLSQVHAATMTVRASARDS
jgi:trans-2-enoyl-CoA reductase